MTSAKRIQGRKLWRFEDWPLGAKVLVSSVGACAALAIGLTALGYSQASAGLQKQADTNLAAGAALVGQRVQDNDAVRFSELQRLSTMPALQNMLIAGPQAVPDDLALVQDGAEA